MPSSIGSSNLVRSISPAAVVLSLVGICALSGCSSSNKLDAKAKELRGNPSPEVTTLYQRQSDVDNALTVTFDENLRMAKEDWGRVWLTDRPSRLTPEPVPR